jgi:hypothetical protein
MSNGTSAHFFNAVVVAAAVALVGPSLSFSADMTMTVSGNSVPSDCGASKKADYAMEMSGSLTGCWATFIAHVNCQEMKGYALWTEIGREEFDGKLGQQATKFGTQYTFNGIFPSGSCPKPSPEKEIVGGCIHYISGESLVGTMRFYDVMYGEGAPHYFYEGTLTQY